MKQLAERSLCAGHATLEVLPDRVAEQGSFIGSPGSATKVDQQGQLRVAWHIVGPVNDEFLGMWVEIALVKWRWVDRTEELAQLIDADADDFRIGRDLVATRRRCRSHGVSFENGVADPEDCYCQGRT
jgi:hypothetical protein